MVKWKELCKNNNNKDKPLDLPRIHKSELSYFTRDVHVLYLLVIFRNSFLRGGNAAYELQNYIIILNIRAITRTSNSALSRSRLGAAAHIYVPHIEDARPFLSRRNGQMRFDISPFY